MRQAALPIAVAAAFSLGACTVAPPSGPSVMALPGQGKSFEAFQQDDVACRQYAWQQTGGASPGAAASQSAVGSAVVGTALGAAAGAAIGSVSGAAGAGAAIGGATGLLAGSAVGANNASAAYGGVQQLYDVSYTQCMYAHGDTVQAPPAGYACVPLSSLSVRIPRLLWPGVLCSVRRGRCRRRLGLARRRLARRGLARRGLAWWRLARWRLARWLASLMPTTRHRHALHVHAAHGIVAHRHAGARFLYDDGRGHRTGFLEDQRD